MLFSVASKLDAFGAEDGAAPVGAHARGLLYD
jgi:hypothetical protein